MTKNVFLSKSVHDHYMGQERPQGERPSHTTRVHGERVHIWEGRSPCGRPCCRYHISRV